MPIASGLPLGLLAPAALGLSLGQSWGLAVGFALALATISLAHESGHALAGVRLGLRPSAIEVFWLGAAVVYECQATCPREKALSAISGPAANLALGLGGVALTLALPLPGLDLATLAFSGLNFGYAILNLVPAYPQDGGQLLHALLWTLMGDERRALRIASIASLGLAGLTLAVSVVVATQLLLLSGILLAGQSVFIGLASFQTLTRR